MENKIIKEDVITKEDLYKALDIVLMIGEVNLDLVEHTHVISHEIMNKIKQMPIGELEAVVKW